jgi:hypothetical protein
LILDAFKECTDDFKLISLKLRLPPLSRQNIN